MIDNSKIYIQYANDIINGRIIACKGIKLACKRMISWFDRDDIYFDYEDVDRKIRIVSRLKHSTGTHSGKSFILLPWQQWCFANIYGWKYKSNNLRVTKNAYILVSRKNGKTALAAAMSIIGAIGDGEDGAEIDFVANNRKQANIGFSHCFNFAESVDPKNMIFKKYRDSIKIPRTKSLIQVLSSDSMGLDGYNSSLTILDEWHAAKDYSLFNVMKSSMGMRSQPLMIVISTAGFLLESYPLYDTVKTCKSILKNELEDDSTFSALYQLDEEDDWKDEDNWIKASPSLGETVSYEYMREQMTMAKNNPSLEVGIKTKNLNMFCQSSEVWLDNDLLKSLSEPIELEQFKFKEDEFFSIYAGIDLASVRDFTAFSIMVPYEGKFYFKTWLFIPEDSVDKSANRELYKQWIRDGYLFTTPGNVTDYDYILEKVLEVNKVLPIEKISYDNWNSTQFAISATEKGLNMSPYSQSLGSFNKPTKEFERLALSKKIVIDDNPVVRWCFSNVELAIDKNTDNVKPTKGQGKAGKIDAVISMIECLGGLLEDDTHSEFFVLDTSK